jgi:hypothetical protein
VLGGRGCEGGGVTKFIAVELSPIAPGKRGGGLLSLGRIKLEIPTRRKRERGAGGRERERDREGGREKERGHI